MPMACLKSCECVCDNVTAKAVDNTLTTTTLAHLFTTSIVSVAITVIITLALVTNQSAVEASLA